MSSDTSEAKSIDKFMSESNKTINEFFEKKFIENGYSFVIEKNNIKDDNWAIDRILNIEFFKKAACTNIENWCFRYVRNEQEIVLQIVFEKESDVILYKLLK